MASDPIQRLRQICVALAEVSERLSHGEPAWFIREKKSFVMLDEGHHGSGHVAFWCPAPVGVQEQMIAEDPQQFFRPPYLGPKGWLGVRIDLDPDWAEIREIVREAYRKVASKKLAALLDA